MTQHYSRERGLQGFTIPRMGSGRHFAQQQRSGSDVVRSRHVQRISRCPLYPQKRTCAVQLAMSALGQKRTHAARQNYTESEAAKLNEHYRPVAAMTASLIFVMA